MILFDTETLLEQPAGTFLTGDYPYLEMECSTQDCCDEGLPTFFLSIVQNDVAGLSYFTHSTSEPLEQEEICS